jgi:multidrug efflux pump subunit AcrA (membrane-fusion protein)
MSRKRAFGLGLFVVLLTVGVVLIYRYYIRPTADQDSEPGLQTATVRQGDLVVMASASGQVVAAAELSVGFKGGGEIIEVLVELGDLVEAGQLLARVDETSALSKLAQAEQNLREVSSPAAIATAQQSLATTQMNLETAYEDLAYLISPSVLMWEERLEASQLTFQQAQEDAQGSSSQETLDALAEAEQAFQLAEQNLEYFLLIYESNYLPDTFTFTYHDRTYGTITYYDPPTEIEIAEARAEYHLAQAHVDEAAALLCALTGDDVPADAAGAGLVKLEQARESVESARLDLEATNLLAPLAGTITSLDAIVGQTVGSNSFITISDLEPPMLQIYLDEMDLEKIAVGYEVEIYFDALPDDIYYGHVVQVEPNLVSMQGVSTIRGLVQIDEAASGNIRSLPVGMNASVDVIAARAEAVLLVPVEALRELEPGVYAVFVMTDGEPKLQVVTVGLMDYAYAEIQSGLEAGDVVTTGIVETD